MGRRKSMKSQNSNTNKGDSYNEQIEFIVALVLFLGSWFVFHIIGIITDNDFFMLLIKTRTGTSISFFMIPIIFITSGTINYLIKRSLYKNTIAENINRIILWIKKQTLLYKTLKFIKNHIIISTFVISFLIAALQSLFYRIN